MKGFTLNKEMLSNRSFYQLIIYAALLGTIVGLATSAFLLIDHWLTKLIWKTIPHRIGEVTFYALFVCTIGAYLWVKTSPFKDKRMPARRFNNVVLPDPQGPMTPIFSNSCTLNSGMYKYHLPDT